MYTSVQLENIFQRIGLNYTDFSFPDEAWMFKIQYAFQKTVPYENLDILHGIPLSLDKEKLYEKIVLHRRGGYCFEINGFLGEVYRSLGYGVKEYMARFLRGETDIPMRRHRVLGVTPENGTVYICDAGIGSSAFRLPLKMENGFESNQYGERYRVELLPFFGWTISDFHRGEWRKFYSFTQEEQLNIDYIMPSFWCEHSPDSPFTVTEMFALKTDTGRITLDGNRFHIFDGERVIEQILTEDEVKEAYQKYFGLPYLGLKGQARFSEPSL